MKNYLSIKNKKFYFNDKPFYLASGDMHYFRYYNQESWKRRLKLMKDFGLTCVQTYVPWNLHEPEKGQFCFKGNLDIEAFFRQCDNVGLKILLRPSVYMCSEWDFGGLPYWLLRDYDSKVRSTDEKFMKHVEEYYAVLFKKIIPYLSTNGGPIIAMAVENEYGSYGLDFEYIQKTKELYVKNGVDVPLYCADGFEDYKMKTGSPADIMTALNVGSLTEETMAIMSDYQPDMPICIAEFWDGKGQQFGGKFMREPAEAVAARYKSILDKDAYANFYMFCGGTNFGFMNGALEGRYRGDSLESSNRYIPYATSYDVDAPVSENGVPTEKYYELKKVLCSKLGTAYEDTKYEYKTQCIEDVKLLECAPVFDNLDNLSEVQKHCGSAPIMESLNQAYGFILYSTHIPHTDNFKRNIRIYGLADRATIYGNGKYLGTYMRDVDNDLITFYIPNEGVNIDILVENMGRICYGYRMAEDRKGIKEFVKIGVYLDNNKEDIHNYKQQTGFEVYTFVCAKLKLTPCNN